VKRKQKPITKHPMFPFVTALWFATFAGLGSFAIAPSLLEGPVVAVGLPAVLPAATPPLGFTARVLLALGLFVIGAVAGLLAGRALARDKTAEPRRTRDFSRAARDAATETAPRGEFEPRRPLNPLEDLGEPLDAAGPVEAPQRRRPLTVADDDALSMPFESAPLPGALPWDNPASAPFAEPAASNESGPFAGAGRFVAHAHVEDAPERDGPPVLPGHAFVDASNDPLALDQLIEQASAAAFDTTPLVFADSGSDEEDELHVAVGLEHGEVEAKAKPEAVVSTEPLAAQDQAVASFPPFAAQGVPLFQAPVQPVTPIERADLDDLGLVQLVERLALAMSRRRPAHGRAVTTDLPPVAPAPPAAAPLGSSAMAAPSIALTPVSNAPIEVSPFKAPQAESPRDVPPAMPRLHVTAPETAPGPVASSIDASFGPDVAAASSPQSSPFDRVVQLRPIMPAFDQHLEDDEDDAEVLGLDRFLRVKPTVATPVEPEGADLHAQAFDADEADADDSTEMAEDEPVVAVAADMSDEVAEDRYPSLLDMPPAPSRHDPLRIADGFAAPLGSDEAAEPVVIFPGQASALHGNSQAATPIYGAARTFDRPEIVPMAGSPLAAPGRAAPSAPIEPFGFAPVDAADDVEAVAQIPVPLPTPAASAPPQPLVDADEADRALRAALATLQRMTAQNG